MQDVTIRRQFKHEAVQAISDLEKRGFRIIYPLTELKRDDKRFTRNSKNFMVFVENVGSSCWVAKMRREEMK